MWNSSELLSKWNVWLQYAVAVALLANIFALNLWIQLFAAIGMIVYIITSKRISELVPPGKDEQD